jgi:hypothetical protein
VPTFSEYRERMTQLHQEQSGGQNHQTPAYLLTLEYIYYAESYIAAASLVANASQVSFLPLMQLTGHAIESAMKACISACRGKVPTGPSGHDLVDLGDSIVGMGFDVSEQHRALVVHVNHLYASDLLSGERYKARYPSKRVEDLGGSIPPHHSLRQLVESLCSQAKHRNEAEGPGGPT